MEEARTDYLEKLGWPYKKMEDEGIISPLINIEASYKKTSTYEDVICIEPVVIEFKGLKLKFKYTMTKEDGTVVCVGKSEHCFLDKNGKPVLLAKTRPDLYQMIMDNVVEDAK